MSNAGAKADLFYGATKTTKTSQIGRAAQYFHKKSGKPLLLYSADNGGWDPIDSLVEAGIVVAKSIRGIPFAPEALDKLSQGWTYNDTTKRWQPPDPAYWAKFSSVAFEGLASAGEWMMDYFSMSGLKLGMSQSFSKIKIGETEYSGLGQDHYGYVQGHLLRCVVNSSSLPVERVIWTSLETKGKDAITGDAIIGPSLVGNKKVDRAGQYFGNMIHLDLLESASIDPTTKATIIATKPVMFLRHHQDPATKMTIPAGTRAPFDLAQEVPNYLDPPDAGRLYQLLDELKAKSLNNLKGAPNVR